MASPSAVNMWIENLAVSLTQPPLGTKHTKSRQHLSAFRRRLQRHNFGRTNQFEVRDRLDGLEEKFQVLNRDDLSDRLYELRTELQHHYESWIPDVLDLLLRLTGNPLQSIDSTDRNETSLLDETAGLLKWADLYADDPLDSRDPIWLVPDFSASSSDEDEVELSTATTSPASVKQRLRTFSKTNQQHDKAFEERDLEQAKDSLQTLQLHNHTSHAAITEILMIRHILLLVQGYPTDIFDLQHERMRLVPGVKLKGVSTECLQSVASRLSPIRRDLDVITTWLKHDTSVSYIQTAKELVERDVQVYVAHICTLEEQLLHPEAVQVTSLPRICLQLEENAAPLHLIAKWARSTTGMDATGLLDSLYELVCDLYFTNDELGLRTILPIFVKTFEVYMQPVHSWLEDGTLLSSEESFFVQPQDVPTSASSLWKDWFQLEIDGRDRAPSFLRDFAHDIFSCGKTVAFINHIKSGSLVSTTKGQELNLQSKIQSLILDPMIPFPAAFSSTLHSYFSSCLISATSILINLLDNQCGMSRTLDAFEIIYLRKQGVLHDTMESRIFARIDKCMDTWNDRFLVADMLEEVYGSVNCIDTDSITVHSVHTSSRSMESRRRSVRILGALVIDYALPWPVANIIPKESLASYRRVALHLSQIRRAKYVLERIAFIHAHSTSISNNAKHQLTAQATTFMLIQFINTLYDHFTVGVAQHLTSKMRRDLSAATNVDAMIAVHKAYITTLEFACLTSKQLNVLRETLIGLLDMCIRFADLLSSADTTSTIRRRGSDDFESGSFRSARSERDRWKHAKQVHGRESEGESEDDNDGSDVEGEGYSSFIVLGEDTSVVQEIGKLQVQFQRLVDFFVAGLRGVGRSGASVDEFEVLADRLEWNRRG